MLLLISLLSVVDGNGCRTFCFFGALATGRDRGGCWNCSKSVNSLFGAASIFSMLLPPALLGSYRCNEMLANRVVRRVIASSPVRAETTRFVVFVDDNIGGGGALLKEAADAPLSDDGGDR